MGRLANHRGYTITALVEALAERAEQRVTARLARITSDARAEQDLAEVISVSCAACISQVIVLLLCGGTKGRKRGTSSGRSR
jgi:putative component of toxin-antitoxin plasmid stabilization module